MSNRNIMKSEHDFLSQARACASFDLETLHKRIPRPQFLEALVLWGSYYSGQVQELISSGREQCEAKNRMMERQGAFRFRGWVGWGGASGRDFEGTTCW